MSPQRITILYGDSGGGHRSLAESLAQALQPAAPGVEVRVVNGREISRFLFGSFARLYPFLVNSARGLYSVVYLLSDGYLSARLIRFFLGLFWGRAARRFIAANPAELYVSCHQIVTQLLTEALQPEARARFAIVVSDPFSPHADCFSERADACLVASPQAGKIAREQGVSSARVHEVGFPTVPDLFRQAQEKACTLASFGLQPGRFTLLVSGGADGLGNIAPVVAALDASGLPVQMIVVCGRNRQLFDRLRRQAYHVPMYLLQETTAMASLLRAADALVAKAGPATIFEAFRAGVPLVLFDAIHGQETGNPAYVCENGAGFFCPTPPQVVAAVDRLCREPALHLEMSARALQLAQPDAAHQAARVCLGLLAAS